MILNKILLSTYYYYIIRIQKKGGIFMATLTINTDEKTAENFYAFCEELGLDM